MVQGEKTDYSKTVIYKIVCKDINVKESYAGHTTSLVKRRYSHKTVCNNNNSKAYNCYLYQFIRENGGWNNWDMIWCYDFPCENKRQAELEERNFIEREKCELNSYKPFRTEEENKQQQKEYNKNNKNKKLEHNKKNKDKIAQKTKEYYKINKQEINNKQNKKKICECGCEINKGNLSRHLKSKKHINLMDKIIFEK